MKKLFIFLFLIFSFFGLQAQQWTKYSTYNSGLSANQVNAIAIDAQGKKWFATNYGVSSFDGTWTKYTTSNGLIANYTTSVVIDNQGNVWVGTNEGVSKFNGSSWTNYTTADGLIDNEVSSIVCKSDGSVWLGTWRGISKYDGVSWTNFSEKQQVRSLAFDTKGNLWIAYDTFLATFDGVLFTDYLCNNSNCFFGNYVNDIAIDQKGYIWLATDLGVTRYNGTEWKNYTYQPGGLCDNMVHSVGIDPQGNKWFGTLNGISKFDDTSWTNYHTTDGLSCNEVLSMAFEGQNTIWFGCDMNGVSKFIVPNLLVEPTSLTLNAAANSSTLFSIHANTSWVVSCDQTWLTITKTMGTGNGYNISVKATENTLISDRIATITVTSPGLIAQQITVKQLAALPFVYSWNPTTILSASANSEAFIGFSANISYTLTCPDSWLLVSNEQFQGNVTTLIRAQANHESTSRTTLITVHPTGLSPQTISVTQLGNVPTLLVSDTVLLAAAMANSSSSFGINSTVVWSISSDQTWLTVDKTTGADHAQIVCTVTENPDTTARNAILTITSGVLSKKVLVTQKGQPYVRFLSSDITIAGHETTNSTSFYVESNTAWEARWKANDWFGIANNGNKFGNASIEIVAGKNPSTAERTGEIYIIQNGVWKTIILKQTTGPYLSLSSHNISFDEAGATIDLNIVSNKNWTIYGSQGSFVGLDKLSGSGNAIVKVTAAANTEFNPRLASLSIWLDDENAIFERVNVVQACSSPYINLSDTILHLSKEKNAFATVSVNTNRPWSASCDYTGFEINPSSGTGNDVITVSCPDGNSQNMILERTLSINTFNDQSQWVPAQNIQLIQESANLYVSLDKDTLRLDPEGVMAGKIHISSNTDWYFWCPSYMTVSKTSGTGNDSITLSMGVNYLSDTRIDSISLYSYNYGIPSRIVYCKQMAQRATTSDTLFSFIPKGGAASVAVSSNVHWSVTQDGNSSWYTINKLSGFLNDTLKISCSANQLSYKNSGRLFLTTSNGALHKIIELSQEPATLNLSPSIYYPYSNVASTHKVAVNANTDWEFSNTDAWLQFDKKSGTGKDTVKITSLATTFPSESRMATITFSLKGFTNTAELKIFQLESIISGLSFSSGDELSVFPNPVHDILSINGLSAKVLARIFSIDGKIKFSCSLNSKSSTVDLRHLSAGVYFIELVSDHFTKRIKILKD